MSDVEDSDDLPILSDLTRAALAEFYQEQKFLEDIDMKEGPAVMPSEDWQLSQFWYTKETTDRLTEEVLAVIGPEGRVACVCCPSIHQKLVSLGHGDRSRLFEVDRRFEKKFGPQFIYYDYKDPLPLSGHLENTFDLVFLDPPFLNEECLSKLSETVRYLTRDKIILCTGERVCDLARKILDVIPCQFIPEHDQLANEFRCYTNYDVITL